MAGDFRDPENPYQSPYFGSDVEPKRDVREAVKRKVMAPAIFLLVVACLGLAVSILNCVYALVVEAPPVDPNAPEFLRSMQENAVGPLASAIQAMFAGLNVVIIIGAIQMMRFRWWPMALAASILSIVNIGTCCCLLGLPAGIWSIVVLSGQDVKTAFMTPLR